MNLKEFAAKEKLEIVLSAPVQGEAGGRGVWGEFRPPSPASSVRIFSNRHRQVGQFAATTALLFNIGIFGGSNMAKIAKSLGVSVEDLLKKVANVR